MAMWRVAAVLILGLCLLLSGCERQRPTYEELKQENAELEGKLAAAHADAEEAQSELSSLEAEIQSCEGEDCNGISVSDLESKLSEIEAETQ